VTGSPGAFPTMVEAAADGTSTNGRAASAPANDRDKRVLTQRSYPRLRDQRERDGDDLGYRRLVRHDTGALGVVAKRRSARVRLCDGHRDSQAGGRDHADAGAGAGAGAGAR
jgi:hypothetical protein